MQFHESDEIIFQFPLYRLGLLSSVCDKSFYVH